MAGLNALDTESTSVEEPIIPVEEQPGVKTGTGKGKTIANESVLEQMQRLYEQKQAQQQGLGGFLETLKDAAAWTSGGTAGPTEALSKRAEDKSKRAAELFDMQNKIAAQKSAIANRNAFFGTQPTAGGAQPTAGGAQPTAGGAAPGVAEANQQSGGLLGLVTDPALRQSIGATYLDDPAKAMTVLNGYLSKKAEEPQIKKEINYLVSLGMPQDKALTTALTKVVGSGAFVPSDVRTPSGTTQKTPLQSAGEFAGTPSSNIAPIKPVNVAGIQTAPSAPAAAPSAPAAAPSAPAAAPSAPVRQAPAAPSAPAAAPSAPVRQAAPTSPSGFTPGSKEDLEFRSSAQKKIMEDTEKRYSGYAGKVEEAYQDAGERFNRYSDVLNVVNRPDMAPLFGQFNKPGIINATVKTIGEGVSAGQFGTFQIKGLEGALANANATPKQIADLRRIEAHLHRAELEYAKTYLTGQGSVSDNERKLVRDTVGSISQPADVIRTQAAVMSERAKFDNAMGKAYNEFKRQSGPYSSFGQFMMSPQAEVLKNQHNKELASILKVNANLLNEPYGKGAEAPGAKGGHPSDIQSIINKHNKRG